MFKKIFIIGSLQYFENEIFDARVTCVQSWAEVNNFVLLRLCASDAKAFC